MNTTGKPIIDANTLEAMAKERPNEKFLKGSGVLKLIQAIRDLERANRQLQAEQPTQIKELRKALQFYADGHHFVMHDETSWDTVSGEPVNFYEDDAGTATVENGSIAKLALAGHPIKFEDEDAKATATAQATPAAPFNTETQDQIAAVILQYGTEDQQRAALAYASAASATQAESAPAQCPYPIDADPQGIRTLVADAITGALAFGAQGKNPPPSGHWLAPFWNAARADRSQADSVLEDAALLDWQASARVEVSPEYEGPWHAAVFGEDEKPVFLASGNTPREALIAARKQGGA